MKLVLLLALISGSAAQLSVHVLDNESGGNGVNMTCVLYRLAEGGGENDFTELNTQPTDSAGRIVSFMPPEQNYTAGTYRIWFGVRDYFHGQNPRVRTFYPAVQVTYTAVDPSFDNHIVLSLSPFGFVTYRGG